MSGGINESLTFVIDYSKLADLSHRTSKKKDDHKKGSKSKIDSWLARAKAVFETGEMFQLRESGVSYHIDFCPENDYTEAKKAYF